MARRIRLITGRNIQEIQLAGRNIIRRDDQMNRVSIILLPMYHMPISQNTKTTNATAGMECVQKRRNSGADCVSHFQPRLIPRFRLYCHRSPALNIVGP